MSKEFSTHDMSYKELYEREQRYNAELRERLTPPTAEEVCKALSEELRQEIYYTNNKYKNGFSTKDLFVVMFRNERIQFVNREYLDHNYKPKTLELIGRFYSGLENNEE